MAADSTMLPDTLKEFYEWGSTNGKTFDCFVFGCATSTIGATDWFGVSTTMLVATVISIQTLVFIQKLLDE
jgi:hypothetical protein